MPERSGPLQGTEELVQLVSVPIVNLNPEVASRRRRRLALDELARSELNDCFAARYGTGFDGL